MIIKDKDLTSIADMSERINSIERQRNELESKEPSPYVEIARKRDAKIAKLTERMDLLWTRRAKLLKQH